MNKKELTELQQRLIDKQLELKRALENSSLTPGRSPEYTSKLNEGVMPVKGGVPKPEPVTRITGGTPHINTIERQPVISMDAHKAKIESKRGLGKKKGLAAILTALGVSALPESAQASVPVQAFSRAVDEGDPMSLLLPSEVGDPEEQAIFDAESDAYGEYQASPASQDAKKFRKIRSSLGNK